MPAPIFTPGEIIAAATAALRAVTAACKLIGNSRKNEHVQAAEQISRLCSDTLHTSRRLLDELRSIRGELKDAGMDLNLPAKKLTPSLFRLKKWRAVRAYNRRVDALVDQIVDIQLELISLAQCKNVEEIAIASTEEAIDESEYLKDLVKSDASLGEILEALIGDSERLNAELSRACG